MSLALKIRRTPLSLNSQAVVPEEDAPKKKVVFGNRGGWLSGEGAVAEAGFLGDVPGKCLTPSDRPSTDGCGSPVRPIYFPLRLEKLDANHPNPMYLPPCKACPSSGQLLPVD